jgi:hypothetical protein
MNRNVSTPELPHQFGLVDVVAIERQARAMQAQAMAELLRGGWRRLNAWLGRAPAGQTA